MTESPRGDKGSPPLFEDMDVKIGQLDLSVDHVELEPSAAAELAAFDRKMLLKLDVLIVPVLAMIYLLAFLDRANIGNARVAGLQKDLGLTDHQYQTAVTVTYVLYIAAEIPSNLLLKKIGPRTLLPGLCLLWGIVVTLQALVNSYSGLLAARLMLGMVEGGSFPGINLYLSMFYRRDELQLRIAMFYSAASLSGAFSGLLAAAISKMDGVGGLQGWQWIFCLEGLFTVVFAPIAYYLLPNTPYQVKTFTPEQAKRCAERLSLDYQFGAEDEKFTISAVASVFKSLHLWPLFLVMFCSAATMFGLAYFTPSIVLGMGFSPIRTQLMTVPPFAAAFVVGLSTAYLADRYRQRGLMALATTLLCIIGIILFYRGRGFAIRYTALFLLIVGSYASGPCIMCWVPNNTAAHTRRATAIAASFICTNIGGMVSTWLFPTSDAPYYPFAARFMLSVQIIAFVLIAGEILLLKRLNAQKGDTEHREKLLAEISDLDFPHQLVRLGDSHPDYKYIL